MQKTDHKPYGPYEKYIKRPLDLICKVIVLILSLIIASGLIAGIIDVIKNRKSKHKSRGIYEA